MSLKMYLFASPPQGFLFAWLWVWAIGKGRGGELAMWLRMVHYEPMNQGTGLRPAYKESDSMFIISVHESFEKYGNVEFD
jgi:hypothetical protein